MGKRDPHLEKYLSGIYYLVAFGFILLMIYYAVNDKSTTWGTFFVLFSFLIVGVFMAIHYIRRNRKKPISK